MFRGPGNEVSDHCYEASLVCQVWYFFYRKRKTIIREKGWRVQLRRF